MDEDEDMDEDTIRTGDDGLGGHDNGIISPDIQNPATVRTIK